MCHTVLDIIPQRLHVGPYNVQCEHNSHHTAFSMVSVCYLHLKFGCMSQDQLGLVSKTRLLFLASCPCRPLSQHQDFAVSVEYDDFSRLQPRILDTWFALSGG